jgi:hypothetical protein
MVSLNHTRSETASTCTSTRMKPPSLARAAVMAQWILTPARAERFNPKAVFADLVICTLQIRKVGALIKL